MNTFEDLKTWQKCREFRKDVSILIKTFPVDEKYRLVDQLKRASKIDNSEYSRVTRSFSQSG
ncbi:four helix bundle protein [Mucilaginibacter sp. BT774]|uniref:four helix bundle protein n=1 Tax=Mucilaginibacter sp. BT774 TaxID=3062276 RepID=UPI0026774F3C|nr:four helix bundle protein [Mucilaginibacter sp. BT774]MDO3627249.1 four helix bundle protein [Mucilaginibacter sp. BT774]